MNPFKDYFLGNSQPPALRIANSQRCLRVSGKHNDLEEVGFDTYHHTFFEMLGNWSFGDYFKQEAIAWAWEFLVKRMGLPPAQLYATVFAGDKTESLPEDSESAKLWAQCLPEEHILFYGKGDNFWEMGASGPCGPCTELHIDLRAAAQRQREPAAALVNRGHPEVIELWNLVFMQYDRRASGDLIPLPVQHVDTGMGFERLCMVMQGQNSAYDTDIFQPLLADIAAHTGKVYGSDAKQDVAFRVIADHLRAITFAMADGALPGPARTGYVVRRLLRRALRYGYSFLGCEKPFMYGLLPTLVQGYETAFPELRPQQPLLERLIREEEHMFLNTLEKGLQRLSVVAEALPAGSTIAGKVAFELYDTYGFPLDLTHLIAKEQGFSIDEPGYQAALEAQRKRSQQAAHQDSEDWVLLADTPHSQFVGYDRFEVETTLLRYRKVSDSKGSHYELVLAHTPFYAEGGGQVGDTGLLYIGQECLQVLDTQKVHAMIVHKVATQPVDLQASVRAVVDRHTRQQTASNHTAAHLLHAALRQVLGDHVMQRGSQVGPKGLRFDFSHYGRMSDEELQHIERLINEKIRENIPLQEEREVPLAEAKARGARALFGEKYGEQVRVITFGTDFSVELCGGTHAAATGALGLCTIQAERAMAAGVRRIEALTGLAALSQVQAQQHSLQEVQALLKHPKDLRLSIEQLLHTQKDLEKKLNAYQAQAIDQQQQALKTQTKPLGPFKVLIARVEVSEPKQLRSMCFALGKEIADLFAVLVAEVDTKPYVAVFVDKQRGATHKVHADALCKQLATHIEGSGGGQLFFAMAGGKRITGLDKVLSAAQDFLTETFTIP